MGAKYIIMEKVPGVQLGHIWHKLELEDRLKIVKQIVRYQKKWMSTTFKQCGSLYFTHDLVSQNLSHPIYIDDHGMAIEDQRYTVGPSTGREYYDAGRASVHFDRGPCM